MSSIVKCDICGQICSQSYLNSHKRLAHKKPQTVSVATHAEPETVKAILQMYGQLSKESQEVIRRRLRVPGFAERVWSKAEREGRTGKEPIQ